MLTFFVNLFPSKSYSTFSFWLEIALRAENLGVWGDSRPLSACSHQRDPKTAPLCVKLRRLSHHACLCVAQFDRYAIARKIFLINISTEKSQGRYISHMHERALIQPIAMEVCVLVMVTKEIHHANFGGCTLRSLVSVKGRT
jgi:hypothetical protein